MSFDLPKTLHSYLTYFTVSDFRFSIKSFIFEKKFKKSKSCSFSEGFMQKTCLKIKKFFFKKSKFSIFLKSLQIHSINRKFGSKPMCDT
eukprot:UN22778